MNGRIFTILILKVVECTRISEYYTNAVELDLSFTDISNFMKETSKFNNLEKLNISHCDINELPGDFGGLNKLEELCASNNQISSFPESFETLIHLKKLDLLRNKIHIFPKSFGKLHSLEVIDVSSNLISNIPITLINLSNLKEFYASNNKFNVFPDSITKIKSLEHLVLSKNQIESIPKCLNLLENIKFIDLSKNEISDVEDCFSKLKNLERIDLSNNKIRSLPPSFRMLNNLKALDLRNNPLDQWGEGDQLGASELLMKYENTVMISNTRDDFVVIDEEEAYKKIQNEQLHWNLDAFRLLVFDITKEIKINKNNLVADLDYLHSNINIDHSVYKLIRDYICRHCDFKNINHMTDHVINLLGNIFNMLKVRFNAGDDDWIRFSIIHIAYSIENESIGRQIAEMKLIYLILEKMPLNNPKLDIFIECIVSVEKEAIFNQIFAPDYEIEYLCNLQYWKNKLKNEIGFRIDGCEIDTLYNDEFRNSPGNVIDIFFKKFTINFIVNLTKKYLTNLEVLAGDLAMKIYERDDSVVELGVVDVKYETDIKMTIERILKRKGLIVENVKSEKDEIQKSSWWWIFSWN